MGVAAEEAEKDFQTDLLHFLAFVPPFMFLMLSTAPFDVLLFSEFLFTQLSTRICSCSLMHDSRVHSNFIQHQLVTSILQIWPINMVKCIVISPKLV